MESIKIDDQMILDQYKIIGELDVNSHNHLYKAKNENETNDNFYIIKAIPYQTHNEISLFQKEADIRELFKDNDLFVNYKDQFEHLIDVEYRNEEGQLCQCKKNYMFVVMEYYKYGDLSQYCFKNNEKQVVNILYQALKALLALSNKSIVHHDIKLGNFLVVSVDPLKIALTDFEFAEKLADVGQTTSSDGTIVFMAPEILNGEAHDLSSDIWSLGVSGYKLAGGSYPFKLLIKDDVDRTREKIERLKLSFPRIEFRSNSSGFKELLSAMLEKDPTKRITVEQALQSELFDECRIDEAEEQENED